METLRTRDGRALTYRRIGDGPSLICHPGGPGGSSTLFGNLGGLARDRTLVLINPRGTGKSDPPSDPDDYGLEAYASDVDEVREHLGLEQIDLLGHSHGGFVGMVYGARYPKRPRRLLLVCTAARFSRQVRQARAAELERHREDPRFADVVAANEERQRGDPADDDELGALLLRALGLNFARYEDWEAALGILEAQGDGFHVPALRSFNANTAPTFDVRGQLPRISAPTLVVAGERDPLGLSASEEIAGLVPDARLVVYDGIGHFPWFENPDQFRGTVLEFLGE